MTGSPSFVPSCLRVSEELEQHFDTAFAAPDGVAKLRELILTLAMQGKLVAQNPNDPPASELLKEVEVEKQRLVKVGKIKKPKPLPPIKPEEVPYQLPQGWEWVRLGEIGIINPRNDAEDSATTGFVPMPLIPEGYSDKHQFEERPWSEIKKGYTHFADGDVGMAKITPCFQNAKSCVFSGLPNGIGAGTTELHIFRNSFSSVAPRFLLYYLKNPNYISRAVPKMTGSAGQKRVPTPYFTEQLFPLPPLPEQHRIVARIDQLMARCDALEKLRTEREEKRLAVHAAAIKQLLDPSLRAFAPSREANSSDLRVFVPSCETNSPFAFLAQHFAELYTVKENVTELRKTILQLAVMGRLVPQDPNDPPARELLKEIEAEKERISHEGTKTRRGKEKKLPPIKPEEVPYQLPQGWEWVRLGTVAEVNGGFAFKSSKYANEGVRVIRISDFDEKGFKNDKVVRYSYSDDLSGFSLDSNNILMAMTGGTVGKSLLVKSLPEPMFVNQRVATIKMFKGVIPEFINGLIRTNLIQSVIQAAKNSTNDNISIGDITGFFVPLPPFPEQHRIVARIDQLMALCDTLDQQIDAVSTKQTEILNALMAQV